eukprot:scaffold287_cov337-Pavlova_lutheri.AAC.155
MHSATETPRIPTFIDPLAFIESMTNPGEEPPPPSNIAVHALRKASKIWTQDAQHLVLLSLRIFGAVASALRP